MFRSTKNPPKRVRQACCVTVSRLVTIFDEALPIGVGHARVPVAPGEPDRRFTEVEGGTKMEDYELRMRAYAAAVSAFWTSDRAFEMPAPPQLRLLSFAGEVHQAPFPVAASGPPAVDRAAPVLRLVSGR